MSNNQFGSEVVFGLVLVFVALFLGFVLMFALQTTVVLENQTPVAEFEGEYVSSEDLSELEKGQVLQNAEDAPFTLSGLVERSLHNSSVEVENTVYTFSESDPIVNLYIATLPPIVVNLLMLISMGAGIILTVHGVVRTEQSESEATTS
jgi:hypothetical protein